MGFEGGLGVTQGSGHYILFFINVNQGNSFSKIEIEAAKTKKDNNSNIVGLSGWMILPIGYYSKNYFKPLQVDAWNTYWQWGTFLVAPYYGLGTEYLSNNGFFFNIGTVWVAPLISIGKYF